MQRKHLAIAGVAALIAAVLVWVLLGGGGGTRAPTGGGAASGTARSGEPVRPGRGGGRDEPAGGVDRTGAHADPAGTLLLEGQVLGDGDQPVGGAVVWLSSQPPRTATTEADGTFSFDRLLPREYTVTARSGDAIGGPVTVAVGPDVAPVVVRLREGAALKVRVTDDAGAPIAGAAVSVEEAGAAAPVTTGADGVATLRGLSAGFAVVDARAPGHAPASTIATVGAAGSTQEVGLVLHTGAAVRGQVVDETGAPVAGAWVTIQEASSLFGVGGDATTSGDDGRFELAAVAAGSYTLTARHPDHAPGTSEIVNVDGVTARDDVVVTMKAAATIRGRVVDAQQRPAPFAAVEVAAKDGAQTGLRAGPLERVTADADGAFAITGLPRAALRLHAENDRAGSTIVDVDVTDRPALDGVVLVLDVDGEIAGVVVDAAGEPVAEAQVSAWPDVFGGGSAQVDDLVFAGFTAATTDGGGAFRLRGLPAGSYLLWASRLGATQPMFGTKGTSAKVGDTGVRIVLPAPGALAGRLAFADGHAPARAWLQVGALPSTTVADGEIDVRDIPAGTYDVRIRGPELAEVVRRDVEVKPGVVTDLGTIAVSRGRSLGGTVVDAAGNPVGGVKVIAGAILFSAGGGDALDPAIADQLGLRTAISAADGSFSILGAPAKGGSVIADDPTRGRSDAVPFAPGDADVAGVTLTLHGYGSVQGVVTMQGKPQDGVQVLASAVGSSAHVVVVVTGADGTFVIDRLPEGDHHLNAMRRSGLSSAGTSIDVHVTAGKRSTVTIDFPVGHVALTVQIKGKGGAKLDGAQLFLFQGTVAARNAQDITAHALGGDTGNIAFWFGGPDFPRYDQLVPGDYTLCVLPINGALADPQFQQRLQDHLADLAVYCQAATVAPSPDAQTITATVPAMAPLPAD